MDIPQESFVRTRFHDRSSFWQRKRKVVSQVTVPLQLQILKETGRYNAFKLEWNSQYSDPPDHPPVPNHLFWDSDVGKWMEAACYFLLDGTLDDDDKSIKSAIEELVQMMEKAQQPDGYLNIHFTVVDPKGRFTNLRDLHELYNAGHLIEAALAQNQWSGSEHFLNCLSKYTTLLASTFGPGDTQIHGFPGHPEIELALLRLYRRSKDPAHLELARYFITERGNPNGQDGRHYYDVEAEKRGEGPEYMPSYYPKPRSYWYQQAHQPIIQQETIEGHSVRAMYLLTAVADMILLSRKDYKENIELHTALERLWNNMVEKKMYMTGAIGAIKKWEGFGPDYFLPQSTDEGGSYGETCAAIGLALLAERMLKLDLDGKYADVMELCLYNAMLGGISLNGKKFTYENQLASSDEQPSTRHDWFTCACCPPNVCRLFGYLGGFLWSTEEDNQSHAVQIAIHLYATATLSVGEGDDTLELVQKTAWPWNGDIHFELKNPHKKLVSVKLRIPQYIDGWTMTPAGPNHVKKGYLLLDSKYLDANPEFTLHLPLKPRFLRPDPRTGQSIVALARGPIVYCLEDVDNDWVQDHFRTLAINPQNALKSIEEVWNTSKFKNEPFVELNVRDVTVSANKPNGNKASVNGHGKEHADTTQLLQFIPYYLRANREGRGHMRVGIKVDEQK